MTSSNDSGTVELVGLRVTAIVGVLPHERVTPQPLRLDINFVRRIDQAAASDDLRFTTNYAEVLALTEQVVINGEFLLLETLVTRVADAILSFDEAIESVTVRVAKLSPPVPQDIETVGVSTVRVRTA